MSPRRPIIAGNWKMHGDRDAVVRLCRELVSRIGAVTDVELVVCPPFPHLSIAHEALTGSNIKLGAQNMYFESQGAFTGEVSAGMLADIGCTYVILGHSERRHLLGETDETINRKISAALSNRLRPIFCVGETLAERDSGATFDVLDRQLRQGLVGVRPEQLRETVVAYEPVWAIGTGKVATPEQAEQAHAHLRETLNKMYGADLAQVIRIQYGGSVKPENVAGLLQLPNVDGALVGGASLKADDFSAIVHAARPSL